MLTLKNIIDEADILVPNLMSDAEKVTQLNAINQDFFNVVKIPKVTIFSGAAGQTDYVLPEDVRAKNIDLVEAGLLKYRDLLSDIVTPVQNTFAFDDSNQTLTLSPAPYQNGLQGIVRFFRVATTIFKSSNIDAVPDAPAEYHWTYVPALAAWIANTQDDGMKASIFEGQYRSAWNTAAQNYVKG